MAETHPSPSLLSSSLLEWYDRHARTLPWRVSPENRRLGEVPDPYRIWLSEVMLQQTTTPAAGGNNAEAFQQMSFGNLIQHFDIVGWIVFITLTLMSDGNIVDAPLNPVTRTFTLEELPTETSK